MIDVKDTKAVEELKEKVKALFADEEAVKELMECVEPEDAKAYFDKKGLEFSLEQVKIMGSLLQMRMENKISDEDLANLEKGEISEALLAEINGGMNTACDVLWTIAKNTGAGAGGGAFMAGAATAITGVAFVPAVVVGAVAGAIGGFAKGVFTTIIKYKW